MIAWVAVTAVLVLVTPALVFVSPTPVPAPGAKEPPAPVAGRASPGFPNIAYLISVDGELPADSVDRRAFVAGLRKAFDADHYPTERRDGGPPGLSMPLTNRFRLVRGDGFGDEWQVSVTIMAWLDGGADGSRDAGSVPPRAQAGDSVRTRASAAQGGSADSLAGLRVNVAVLSPEAAAAGARPLPLREDLLLRMPRAPRAAWFSHAGRMVGLLAVEELHHQSGDLAADTGVRLDRTVRRPVIARRPSTPHR